MSTMVKARPGLMTQIQDSGSDENIPNSSDSDCSQEDDIISQNVQNPFRQAQNNQLQTPTSN